MYFPSAPSAPPTSVSTSDVTSSSITVQWGPVDCIHRNGDITGYSVQYGVQGNVSTQTMSVSGGATTEATISGLNSATTYSIEVAAVNGAGTGDYSNSISAITSGTYIICSNTLHISDTESTCINHNIPFPHPCSGTSSGDCGLHNTHHHPTLLD